MHPFAAQIGGGQPGRGRTGPGDEPSGRRQHPAGSPQVGADPREQVGEAGTAGHRGHQVAVPVGDRLGDRAGTTPRTGTANSGIRCRRQASTRSDGTDPYAASPAPSAATPAPASAATNVSLVRRVRAATSGRSARPRRRPGSAAGRAGRWCTTRRTGRSRRSSPVSRGSRKPPRSRTSRRSMPTPGFFVGSYKNHTAGMFRFRASDQFSGLVAAVVLQPCWPRSMRLPAEQAERELLTCCAVAGLGAGGRRRPAVPGPGAPPCAAADAATARLSWPVSRRHSPPTRGSGSAPPTRPEPPPVPAGRRPGRGGSRPAWRTPAAQTAGRAGRGEPGVRGAVRPRLPDLRHRPDAARRCSPRREPGCANDAATERRVVREELRKIARLRLERLLALPRRASRRAGGDGRMTLSTHVLDTARGRARGGRAGARWSARDDGLVALAEGVTDDDGRLRTGCRRALARGRLPAGLRHRGLPGRRRLLPGGHRRLPGHRSDAAPTTCRCC